MHGFHRIINFCDRLDMHNAINQPFYTASLREKGGLLIRMRWGGGGGGGNRR